MDLEALVSKANLDKLENKTIKSLENATKLGFSLCGDALNLINYYKAYNQKLKLENNRS